MTRTKNNCICVIQARRGSSRLPDKVLLPLAGKPVLAWVIERCQRIDGVDKVICAIPDSEYNDPLAEVAEKYGAHVVRGDEQDVLSRYKKALDLYPADYVMRVTADCPLIDPEVCADLLNSVVEQGRAYGVTARWPHGLDCEVVEANLLLEADAKATSKEDREHVTLWIKRIQAERMFVHRPDQDYAKRYRWTLDYPEDWDFFTALTECFDGKLIQASWRDILAVVQSDKSLQSINRSRGEEWERRTRAIYERAALGSR